MPSVQNPPPTLRVRIGRWFEASATGWGVAAIPLVVFVLVAAAAVGAAVRLA